MTFKALKADVVNILTDNLDLNSKLLNICSLLNKNIPHYNWVGFYFKNRR